MQTSRLQGLLPVGNFESYLVTRSRSSHQPKLGFSAVRGLPSPFDGPESCSRYSAESLWPERCVKALRPDTQYLQTNGKPGQGRPQPAKRTLDAVCRLSY